MATDTNMIEIAEARVQSAASTASCRTLFGMAQGGAA